MNTCGSKLKQEEISRDFCRNPDCDNTAAAAAGAGCGGDGYQAGLLAAAQLCKDLRHSPLIAGQPHTSAHLSITDRASPGRRDQMTH